MDGTTDASTAEDEHITIMSIHQEDTAEEAGLFTRCFCIEVPRRADTDHLIVCFQKPLQPLGVQDVLSKHSMLGTKPILIGGGTDGASVNIADKNR